jgi:gluconolactonase
LRKTSLDFFSHKFSRPQDYFPSFNFAAGPGGRYALTPEGTQLGWFDLGGPTGNSNWGEDGSTLFVTSGRTVYRIRLNTKGAGY